jgi:hypothetical protein
LRILPRMLLKIFKTNPLLLLVFGIALSAGLWAYTLLQPAEITRPYTDITLLAPFFDRIHDLTMLKGGLGFAILLIEAGIWNRIVNRHSLLKQTTWFPFFFMVVLLSCRPTLVGFYPALVSSLFLVLAVNRLISAYMKESALREVFDSGLCVGIATLFYIPSMVFLLLLWIGLIILRAINWREWACTIIGFLLPFVFTFTYNLVFFPNYPWYKKITGEFFYHSVHLSFSWEQITIMILLFLTAAGSLWFYVNRITDNVVKAQKFWTLLLWFILIAASSILICPVKDSRAFSLLATPGSFILSAYFLKTKSKFIPELLFLSLLTGVIISMVF